MKTIVITGSSGLVATELIHHLLSEPNQYQIYAVSSNPNAIREIYPQESVTCLTLETLQTIATDNKIEFDVVVHCAFSRSGNGHDIATSLDYLRAVISLTKKVPTKTFINISSQSVYGSETKPFWTENTSVAPNYLYAVGKYASEVITHTAFSDTQINYTNVRLASVCENARFMNIFARNALSNQPIIVFGGEQTCSFIDVRDVARGLSKMIEKSDEMKFADTYNLGTGMKASVLELANITCKVAKEEYGIDCSITQKNSDISQDVGMDVSRFSETFSWEPDYDYAGMIKSLLELNKGGGGKIPYFFKVKYLKIYS